MVMSAGAVYENQKSYIIEQFTKKLNQELTSCIKRERISACYVFAPKHLLRTIVGRFPTGIKKIIKASFGGNYTDEHPFGLLEKVALRRQTHSDVSLSVEEAKIKAKARQARSVIRSSKSG